jgi:DNA repair exonuclease SbcCD ATPase subunit
MKKTVYLAITLITFGMIPTIYADSNNDDLLRIALEADQQILLQINSIYGSTIPSHIKSLYEQGHQSVIELENSIENNSEESKENFLSALKSFKQISKFIQKSSDTANNLENKYKSYKDEIQRLEKFINSLKSASQKLNSPIDFTNVDSLLSEIKQKISNNENDTRQQIDELKSLTYSLKQQIHETSSHKNQDKFINFMQNQLDQFEIKLQKFSNNESDPDRIEEIRSLISQTRTLISEKNFEDAKIIFNDITEVMKNI